MTESEFIACAEATLTHLESALDAVDAEVDVTRAGNVLTLTFDDDSRIVVNSQTPMQQLWVAARSGGFHYGWDGTHWRDTRDGTEFFATLSRLVSTHAGGAVVLAPRT
jgi:CyaY protein